MMPPDNQRPAASSPHRLRRWLDRLLVAAMVAAASVLACQELCEADAWWHLRTGQWILENRRVPTVDPFSFASADREWIDLHWGFQVALALAYRFAGVAGMIVLASTACGLTMLIAMTARMREWPAWVIAGAWVPALVLMSTRVPPRPEVFSLAFLAAYMAILLRCDRRPALAWALPAIQVLWVNSHALFVLGPVVLGAYIADAAIRPLLHRRMGPRWWLHIGLASVAVVAVCFINPYGVRGALFPLELLPKIGPQGGIYKANILEFYDPSRFLQDAAAPIARRNLFGRGLYFLLLMLPASFLIPAIWETWTKAMRRDGLPRPSFAGRWILGTVIAVGLTVFATFSLPLANTPDGLLTAGRWAPVGFLALGIGAAAVVVWRSPLAALLSACGGVALAGGAPWLAARLIGHAPEPASFLDHVLNGRPWISGLAAALALYLILRAGGRLFRILLAIAFGFLALQAVRNVNIFSVMAGFVVASELGEWAAKVLAGRTGTANQRWDFLGIATRAVMIGVIVTATVAVATGQLPEHCRWPYALGLRETPSVLAHEAARFAGRPGMPIRCLAFGLDQAAVYLFHNGPERKPFMDPRLEVASEATFEAYLWIDKAMNEGRPGWSERVERMDDPSILLDHNKRFGAEATLLADPRWRCVYYDAVASVFVPSRLRNLDASCPTIDFAARYFQPPRADQGMNRRNEALDESIGLVLLGNAMPATGAMTWTRRLPILLLAGARAREALAVTQGDSRAWLALACALWQPGESGTTKTVGPVDPWDPALSLVAVQATLLSMTSLYRARGMIDASELALELSRQGAPRTAAPDAQPLRITVSDELSLPSGAGISDLSNRFEELLRRGRTLAAIELVRHANARGTALPWNLADRVAVAHLHLGEPAEARRYWENAQDPPSPALRLARIAQAEMAANDPTGARKTFHTALELDPRLGEPWFGLALLELQSGDADATLAACRAGISSTLTRPQREVLEKVKSLIDRFASSGRASERP